MNAPIQATVKARLLFVALAGASLSTALLPAPTQAGPALRRAQERKACKEFAGKLQAVSGNPQQAQVVYQQGVLKLVEQFGENPCGDIPAPTAAVTPASGANPATTTPAAAGANPQQTEACQQFAAKLQAAQGNPAQAQQVYATGSQKLISLYGPNPCPSVPKP